MDVCGGCLTPEVWHGMRAGGGGEGGEGGGEPPPGQSRAITAIRLGAFLMRPVVFIWWVAGRGGGGGGGGGGGDCVWLGLITSALPSPLSPLPSFPLGLCFS